MPTYSSFITEQGRLADEALSDAAFNLAEADRHHRAVLAGRILELTDQITGLRWDNLSGQACNIHVCMSDYTWILVTSERFAEELEDPREVRRFIDLLTGMPEFKQISQHAWNSKVTFEFEDVTGNIVPSPDPVPEDGDTEAARAAVIELLIEKIPDQRVSGVGYRYNHAKTEYQFYLTLRDEAWREVSQAEFRGLTDVSYGEFVAWLWSLDEFRRLTELRPHDDYLAVEIPADTGLSLLGDLPGIDELPEAAEPDAADEATDEVLALSAEPLAEDSSDPDSK